MNDIEFMLHSENREKKITGHGAARRKGRGGTKKCTLPSDYLTKKELKAMSGECQSYNLNKFYTVSEFKALPQDIQIEWINSIIKKYGVGLGAISTTVLGKANNYLLEYTSNHGFRDAILPIPSKTEILKNKPLLEAAVNEQRGNPQAKAVIADVPEIEAPPEIEPVKAGITTCSRLHIELDNFDPTWIQILENQFKGQKVKIQITVKSEVGDPVG